MLDVDLMPRTGFMLGISAVHMASAPPGLPGDGSWIISNGDSKILMRKTQAPRSLHSRKSG